LHFFALYQEFSPTQAAKIIFFNEIKGLALKPQAVFD